MYMARSSHTHKYLRTSCRAPTRSVSSIRTDVLGGPSSSLLLVTVAVVAQSTPAMAAAANRRMAVVVVVLWMMGIGNGRGGRRGPTQAPSLTPTLTPTLTPRPATAAAALVVVAVVAVRTDGRRRIDRIAIMFNAIYLLGSPRSAPLSPIIIICQLRRRFNLTYSERGG